MVVIVAQASGSLRIIEDLFQNRVTINAGQSIVEVGETIVLFGQGVSAGTGKASACTGKA